MPIYVYRCPKDGSGQDVYTSIKDNVDKLKVRCLVCGGKMKRIICPPQISVFKEYYSECMETWVNSPKHERMLHKKHGVHIKEKGESLGRR